jgi:tetratricopeptide (TPR) repeat protein
MCTNRRCGQVTNDTHSSATEQADSQVTIGDVPGGIHGSVIAGRDVIQHSTRVVEGPEAQRERRNRRILMNRVREFWIEGVLENSVQSVALIELGKEELADAVEPVCEMVVLTPAGTNRSFPSGKRIIDIFEDMEEAMLILGEPGAGKTITLLQLAQDAIARAEADPTQPIPVVFNLSSWALRQEDLTTWLVGELHLHYQIPRNISRAWLENDDLLLLLDGLDEVQAEQREGCVQAINDFHGEHGVTSLAICSRIADYEALSSRLKLNGAVFLKPLTPEKIDDYLAGVGVELLAVRKMLEHDRTLQELARTPLMLSIMILAYRGMSVADLRFLDSIEDRRHHLFDTYVKRMLAPRLSRSLSETASVQAAARPWASNVSTLQDNSQFPPEKTIQWLTWLAQKIHQHSQTEFLIEQLQPSWLSTRRQRRIYALGSRILGAVAFGLVFALVAGSIAGLFSVWESGEIEGLALNVGIGLILVPFCAVAGLSAGLIDAHKFETGRRNITDKELVKRRSNSAVLLIGLGAGLIPGLLVGLSAGAIAGLAVGLVFAAFFGLIWGLRSKRRDQIDDIQTVESLTWSWSEAEKGMRLSLISLFLGVVVAGFRGLHGSVVERKTVPNQGMRLSLRNAIITGFIFSIVYVLFMGALSEIPTSWPTTEQTTAFNWGTDQLGIFIGMTFAFWYGGLDVIQHFTLRLVLYLTDQTPANYSSFLDYATERVFLRKVGGGYIFIHRLLLEHFAGLENAEEASGSGATTSVLNVRRKHLFRILRALLLLVGVVCFVGTIVIYGADVYDRYQAPGDYYTRAGLVSYESGDLEQAIANYTKAIESAPTYAEAYYRRGVAYYDSGDLKRAISDHTKAIDLDPAYADAYLNRGTAYHDSGYLEQAIADYTRAIELDPVRPSAYVLRGVAYYGSGAIEQAISDYTKFIELVPGNVHAYVLRGVAYHDSGNLEQAISDYTEAIDLHPDNADAYFYRGCAYYQTGNRAQAIDDFVKAIALDAYFYESVYYYLEKLSNPELGIQVFTEIIERDPDGSEAFYYRGLAYQEENRAEQAIQDFERYIELRPDTLYRNDVTRRIEELKSELER